MKPRLLDFIACPDDHASLELVDGAEKSSGGEIESGALRCPSGHEFAIEGGVPRMVPPEARESSEQEGTFESFSSKWTSVEDSAFEELEKFQYAWYDERYGWGDESKLGEFLKGQEVLLDAGTGIGRDAARFARLSDGEAIGMDLSEAIGKAHGNYGSIPNVHYVQGDILNPPFAPDTFTFVSSDQVIHHTPDAPRAFATLAGLVKPGGSIAVYVYKVKALIREMVDDQIRDEITPKMSVEECMEFSEALTDMAKALSDLDAKITLEKDIPLLGIEAGEHDVQRLIYWNFIKAFWKDEWSYGLNVLTNFDWYHPPYATRHTEEEVRGWCDEAKFEPTHLDVMESGISVLAARGAS